MSEFLLDTGTFIQPFRAGYYSFDICPGYWRFLKSQLRLDGAPCLTIAEVVAEVEEKDDELHRWLMGAVASRALPKAKSDERAVRVFQELVEWANTKWRESCLRAAEAVAASRKCKDEALKFMDTEDGQDSVYGHLGHLRSGLATFGAVEPQSLPKMANEPEDGQSLATFAALGSSTVPTEAAGLFNLDGEDSADGDRGSNLCERLSNRAPPWL